MRAIVFDAIDATLASRFWRPGARLYTALGKADVVFAGASVSSALAMLALPRQIEGCTQVEWWCHGWPGGWRIGSDAFDHRDLENPEIIRMLVRVGDVLRENDGVFWLRTCASFAGLKGQLFASRLANEMGCRVAGHTYRIGPWQAGLHTLEPGQGPYWDETEGTRADGALGQADSWPWSPNSISAFRNRIPDGW